MSEPLKFDVITPLPGGSPADAIGAVKVSDTTHELYFLKLGTDGRLLHRRIGSTERTGGKIVPFTDLTRS